MRLKNFKYMASALLAAAFITACSSDDVVQNGQGNNNNNPAGIVFEGENATPAHNNPATRTTATHIIGQGAKVAWETTDEIWVKDDAGTFQKSTSTTFKNPANKANATFALGTGSFTSASHQVVYTGKGSTTATEVEIKAIQTQTATNSFAHLGESGDCGIATATGSGGQYGFKLEHKAAYLAFYPRIQGDNILRGNVKIEKITITSDDAIAGKYAFSATTGLSSVPTSGSSNSITLNTPSGELSLTTDANICYYVVLAPGNHHLKAAYQIFDPTTNVRTTVTKDLGTIPCTVGKITDVAAWVNKDFRDLPSDMVYPANPKYYMWGAQHDYWYGKTPPYSLSDKPQPGDPNGRYNAYSAGLQALPSAYDGLGALVPNANEMAYYVTYGDAHWVDETMVFVRNDHHLVYGTASGIYLRKKSVILDYLHANGFPASFSATDMKAKYYASPSDYSSGTGTDLRSTSSSASKQATIGLPTNLSEYFFLASVGVATNAIYGSLYRDGYYWGSSANPNNPYTASVDPGYEFVFSLRWGNANVSVSANGGELGCSVAVFE